uniref:Prolyl 4-hydroxylase alpha subunit Fe(2+) 2OG dioxygenase domain-containing protein n=1 Tax=Amorphochlora amoebiformis TaxID=1561963 RepID=A0A7S0DRM3_9EUKA
MGIPSLGSLGRLALVAIAIAWVMVPADRNYSLYSRTFQHPLQVLALTFSHTMHRVYEWVQTNENWIIRPVTQAIGFPFWFHRAEFWLDILIKNVGLNWYDSSVHNTQTRMLVENFVDIDTCKTLIRLAEEYEGNSNASLHDPTLGPHSQVLQARRRPVFSFDDFQTMDPENADLVYSLQNHIHAVVSEFFGRNFSLFSANIVTRYTNQRYSMLEDQICKGHEVSPIIRTTVGDLFKCPQAFHGWGLCCLYTRTALYIDSLFSNGINLHCDAHEFRKDEYFFHKKAPQSSEYFERTHSALLYLDTDEVLQEYRGGEIFFVDSIGAHRGHDRFASFSDLLFGRVRVKPRCGNLMIYKGDEGNVHGVTPVGGKGHRHSLAMWFTDIDSIVSGLQEIAKKNRMEKCSTLRPEGAPDCEGL